MPRTAVESCSLWQCHDAPGGPGVVGRQQFSHKPRASRGGSTHRFSTMLWARSTAVRQMPAFIDCSSSERLHSSSRTVATSSVREFTGEASSGKVARH